MAYAQRAFIAALLVAPTVTLAQGFSGAELSAGMMAWSEDTNLGASSYAGGVGFDLVAGIGVEADISRHNWRGVEGNSTAYTLHATYGIVPGTTIGVFAGQDRREAGDSTLYGIEGATTLGGFDLSGYLGQVDGASGTGSILGLDASFAFSDALAATARAGVVDDGTSMSSIALGGEYRFGQGPVVFAQVGRSDESGTAATYVTLGGRIELGDGTAFGPRGLTDVIPGF
ncbi:MAG: hypothetical protein IT542_01330 [Rubellimicrobium sp.]|nr:hypothetical protein [Rubellimicrobium sp.]